MMSFNLRVFYQGFVKLYIAAIFNGGWLTSWRIQENIIFKEHKVSISRNANLNMSDLFILLNLFQEFNIYAFYNISQHKDDAGT